MIFVKIAVGFVENLLPDPEAAIGHFSGCDEVVG
jgi:hypothetical protein